MFVISQSGNLLPGEDRRQTCQKRICSAGKSRHRADKSSVTYNSESPKRDVILGSNPETKCFNQETGSQMDLTQPRQLFLNGAWRSVGPALAVTNPATGEKIGEVSTIDRQSLRQAIDDAAAAWPPWRERTGKDRGDYLHRIGDRIEA